MSTSEAGAARGGDALTSEPGPMGTDSHRAGPREWAGLAVLTLPVLLVSMDMTVLHLAVPQMTRDLGASGTHVLWIVDIYAFMVAGLLITMGAVGDRIGRRRLLLIGGTAFAVASLAAAFATGPGALIAARAALGVAGATLAPSTLALIRTMFHDPQQRSTATSLWVLAFLTGAAVGPIVGGLLLQTFWWGSVFLLAIPVMAVLLIAGPLLLPEYRDPSAARVDVRSAATSLAAVLAVVYGLKEVAVGGDLLPGTVAVGAGGLLVLAFVRRQGALTRPLIDLGLFRSRSFSVAIGVLTLGSVVLAGVGFLSAQYLQLVLGLQPLTAGLWTLPQARGRHRRGRPHPSPGPAPHRSARYNNGVARDRGRAARPGAGAHQRGRRRGGRAVPGVRGPHADPGPWRRHGHRLSTARACRRGLRPVGDHSGARGRTRHSRARKHREHRLPGADATGPGQVAKPVAGRRWPGPSPLRTRCPGP